MSQNLRELFILIKSMTQNQKRSFTIQCNIIKPNSNLLALFNALKKFEEYDEEKIIQYLLKNGKHKLVDNLASETTVLFNFVLKVLRFITDEKNISYKLENTFREIIILQERGLFGKAQRRMKKLKSDANLYDQKELLSKIYKHECRTKRDANGPNYLDFLEETYKKQHEIGEAKQLEDKLSYFYNQMFYIIRNISILKKSETKEQLAEVETALNKIDIEQYNYFNTKMYYLSSMTIIHHLKSDKKAVFKYLEEIHQIYKSDKNASKTSDFKYIKVLAGYLNFLVIYNQPKEQFLEVLAEIKNIEPNSPEEERIIFSDVCYMEFLYYLKQGNFVRLDNLVPALLKGLKKYDTELELGRKITIWQNLMIYYFFKGDFYLAHVWIKKILLDGKASRRKDLLNISKFFKLLVEYELEKFEEFESLIRKIKKSFKMAKNSNELVNLITQMMNNHYKKAPLIRKDFVTALQQFDKIDQSKNLGLPYDEVKIWLKSKVERKPILEIAIQMLQNK